MGSIVIVVVVVVNDDDNWKRRKSDSFAHALVPTMVVVVAVLR